MFKMRVALLGAMALLVVSGFAASTASAAGPYWHVGGSRFEKGATGIKLQLKGSAKLSVPGIPLTIICTSSHSDSGTINGNGTNQGQDKGQIKYTGCTVTESPAKPCTVAEPIQTNITKSYLAIAGTRIVDVFEPESGEVFAELKLKCGIVPSPEAIKGSVAANVTPEGTERREGDLQFPEKAITSIKHEGGAEQKVGLKVGATNLEATFSAGYSAGLESGANFGVTET